MTERPILFSGPLVRAILEGRKTQTRRVCNPQPFVYSESHPVSQMELLKAYVKGRPCRYGQPGDGLWVRETFQLDASGSEPNWTAHSVIYGDLENKRLQESKAFTGIYRIGWRPSIHMPRWASRITLEVTAVRVQRLTEISEEDAKAEGVGILPNERYKASFGNLWDSINAARGFGWDKNPWVWAISFRRVKP